MVLDLVVDVPELRVPVGVLSALKGLGIGLQTETVLPQQPAHGRRRGGMALPRQLPGQRPQRPGRPPQRRHRIAPFIRLDQRQQRRNEQRVKLLSALATATVPADPAIGQRILTALQLEDTLPHRRLAHPCSTRDGPDPAVPQQPGLGSRRQLLLPLIQMREQHPESQGKLVTDLARYAHTAPTTGRP